MGFLYIIIFILTFFIGANITDYYNISLTQFHFILIILWLIIFLHNSKFILRNKYVILLLLFTFSFVLLKLFTDNSIGIYAFCDTILLAPIAATSLPIFNGKLNLKNIKIRRFLLLIIILSFLGDVVISIIERLTQTNFFEAMGTTNEYESEMYFRSHGIYGHPLYNSLILSIGMSFILISPFKNIIKFTLWTLGFIAILCFNTRSSMVLNLFFMALYLFRNILLKRGGFTKKMGIVVLAIFGGYVIYNLFIQYGFGGRMQEYNYSFDDGSSQTRLLVFRIFDYIDTDTWLFGTDFNGYRMLKKSAHITVTENYWIDWLLRLGIIFMIGYILLFKKVLQQMYKRYKSFDKYFTLISFLFVSSMNNSLSINSIALVIFLLYIDIFNPNSISLIIPSKFIERR